MKKKKLKKICFAASSGGHFEQLMMLKPLMEQYESFILTEKTHYNLKKSKQKVYCLLQVNREERGCYFKLLLNSFYSLLIYLKERPSVVISTGVLATIPMCLLCKICGGKLIYIESFAKVTTGTETGKLLYRFADQFYVQWEKMLDVYPNAIFKGGIY